jgi:hypothetical protein
MKIRSTLALLATFGLLVGAAFILQACQPATASAQEQPAPLATATMPAQATQTPAEPTNAPTATIGHQSTIIALEGALNAAKAEEARAKADEAQAVQQAAAIEATKQAASIAGQQQLAAMKITEAAIVRDTAQAEAAKQAEINRAAELAIQAQQVEIDARRDWMLLAGVIAAFVLLAFGIVVFVRGRERESEYDTDGEEVTSYEERPEWKPRPQVIQVESDNEAMQYPTPITPEQAKALVDAGGLLGALSFRGVQRFGITRAAWNDIRRDLVPVFAEYDKSGAIVLNYAGVEMLNKIYPPLTHNPARVSVQGNSADTSRHDTAQHTPQQGGAVVGKDETE